MSEGRRHSQAEIEEVILDVLASGSVLTTAEVTKAVKQRISLVPGDRERAAKRPNESKVDQIIANALQAKRTLCRQGLVERVEDGCFRITPTGNHKQADRQQELALMADDLKGLLGKED